MLLFGFLLSTRLGIEYRIDHHPFVVRGTEIVVANLLILHVESHEQHPVQLALEEAIPVDQSDIIVGVEGIEEAGVADILKNCFG